MKKTLKGFKSELKMKKIFIFISLFVFHSYFCAGQTNDENDGGKIEDIKKAYMARELNLTPEEAKKFWPLYDDYYEEVRQAKKVYANDEVAYEESIVNIKRKYKNNFNKVLHSDYRVNKVFVSEKNLRDMLKKELQTRKIKRQGNLRPPPQKRPKN